MSGNLATKQAFTNFDLMSAVKRTRIAKAFDLKTTTFAVLFCLCDHYNYKNGVVYPSIETIAVDINASAKTASRGIQELISKGLIIKTKSGLHNIYCFTNIFWDFIKTSAEKTNKITKPKNNNTGQFVKTTGQIVPQLQDNLSPKQNKGNKINNSENKFLNFSSGQPKGVNYPSPEKTKTYIQESLKTDNHIPPDKLSREEALKWCQNIPDFLKHKSITLKSLTKKWNFSPLELSQKPYLHLAQDNLAHGTI
jgi:predicted transcriptional regulator